jgi:cysteine desulfurase
MFGGGQERGLRPGTLPVPLIVGFGEAAALALSHNHERSLACKRIREQAVAHLTAIGGIPNGSQAHALYSTLNMSFPRHDSEAMILALKPLIAVSNGSACTSQNYSLSHVLTSMELPEDRVRSAIRFSWSHLTPPIPWREVAETIKSAGIV